MTSQHFQVIPAVDLLGEEAVRLEQGNVRRIAARAEPEELVRRFAAAGAELIHLVDLDGARRGGIRVDLVRRLIAAARPALVQASGGIRSVADAERLLASGASRVVVGTAALADTDALERFAGAIGDRLVVAIDVRRGRVSVCGWTEDTGIDPTDLVRRCHRVGVTRLLCTAIERDGMLAGPDLELLRELCEASPLRVLAASGVRSGADLVAVAGTGWVGAVVGRALLDGLLPLSAVAG
jgi:phosphoribosylformimino-5-aminoimidazole carboxamide ribotide isomerase